MSTQVHISAVGQEYMLCQELEKREIEHTKYANKLEIRRFKHLYTTYEECEHISDENCEEVLTYCKASVSQ